MYYLELYVKHKKGHQNISTCKSVLKIKFFLKIFRNFLTSSDREIHHICQLLSKCWMKAMSLDFFSIQKKYKDFTVEPLYHFRWIKLILKPQVNNKNKFSWGIIAKSDTSHCPSFPYNQSLQLLCADRLLTQMKHRE